VTHARAVYCTGNAAFLRLPGPDRVVPTLIPFVPSADTMALSLYDQCALFFRNVTCWGPSSADPIHVPANILTMSAGLSTWFGLGADGQGYFWGSTHLSSNLDRAVRFEGDVVLSAVGSSNETPCGIEADTGILFCWTLDFFDRSPSNPVAIRPPS
jgi:hypothetical protein